MLGATRVPREAQNIWSRVFAAYIQLDSGLGGTDYTVLCLGWLGLLSGGVPYTEVAVSDKQNMFSQENVWGFELLW